MELTQGSETSANYNLTPGKYPKEHIQCSTDFGTNMTGVGFWVIIYITMFWDVTSSGDEHFERHTLQFMYPAMEAALPAI